jgi:hypothetical protein
MSKDEHIKAIFRKMQLQKGVSINDFKKCLVHISHYEAQKSQNVGNSRFVFMGMYGFKGVLADYISKYIAGNGKQLQQYLGNVFSNEKLAVLFDDLQLQNCITLHQNLDYKNLKHVFANAYLGFVHQHGTEAFVRASIHQYFLKDSDHLLPKAISQNLILILKSKVDEVLSEKIKIINDADNELFRSKVVLSSGIIIGEHSSKSKVYAKKRAIKLALKYVLEIEAQRPEIIAFNEKQKLREQEQKNRQKAENIKVHDALMQTKKAERLAINKANKEKAEAKETNRILNKKRAKNSPIKSKSSNITQDLSTMSANKRRHLEDKQK